MTSKEKRHLSPEDQRILREHWEWAGRYAILWVAFDLSPYFPPVMSRVLG